MIILAVLLGSLIGAVGIVLLTFLMHLLFAASLLKQGLYILMLIFVAPQGGFLGAVSGGALALMRSGRYRQAILLLIVGSTALVLSALFFANGYPVGERLSYIIGYFTISMVWSVLLILWALFLLSKAAN